MSTLTLFPEAEAPQCRAGIVPRDYQIVDHDESFRLWDAGTTGVLTRGFTGCGKTLQSCLKADTWLQRSSNHRVMVISYEEQLVKQFAQEVEDYLGITAAIEMADLKIDPQFIPPITIASRASLLVAKPPTEDQIAALRGFGINDPGCAPGRSIKRLLRLLKDGVDVQDVRDELARINAEPEAKDGCWSRVHKFDWHYDWLVCFDEAHKHAHHLVSVGHLVDWFGQNPNSRRSGATATPKRFDGKSIGDKMFPGIAMDYPLYKPGQPCGVSDGWAVPYKQRYIEVEGVDFKTLKKIAGDFDEGELEHVLGQEETLAKLIEPLLDMVGDRRTLIFSPGVQMAKDVAQYINARSRAVCTCSRAKWYPTLLIGDGAQCACGRLIETSDVDLRPDQARELDGTTVDRTPIYEGHQAGEFQFLSICGLCREGYNDPDISCVAVFRPVSKKASALAEQMKGRSCRPLRGLLNGLELKEDRLAAIAESTKPYALIVDLVGITGLADCASTVQIYSEGLPDTIQKRAADILAEDGLDGEVDVEGAIEQAKREDSEAREKARLEREAAEQHSRELAERRAKAGADVTYTTHEVGVGSNANTNEATEKQYRKMAFLGMDIRNTLLSKRQAGRIIDQLLRGVPIGEVARTNRISEENWMVRGPSAKQQFALHRLGRDWIKTPADASLVISAMKNPTEFSQNMTAELTGARDDDHLTNVAHKLVNVSKTVRIAPDVYSRLVALGTARRAQLRTPEF